MLDQAALPFLSQRGHIVSLVGGGGKTTLLYQMSAHCARKGWRVLASTTTHIRCPQDGHWAPDAYQRDALWAAGTYAVAGKPAAQNKLTQPACLEEWMQAADAVFLEADGAKGLPCKAPAAHEPVLLPQSDILLAVAGLERPGPSAGAGLFPRPAGSGSAGGGTGCPADPGAAGAAACKSRRGAQSSGRTGILGDPEPSGYLGTAPGSGRNRRTPGSLRSAGGRYKL